MTLMSREAELYRLENERSDILRARRERQAKRWGLGHGAVNAACDLDLLALFEEDQERAEDARLAELEKRIAEHQALDLARRERLRAHRLLEGLMRDGN